MRQAGYGSGCIRALPASFRLGQAEHFRLHFINAFQQPDAFAQFLTGIGEAADPQSVQPAQFNPVHAQCTCQHIHHAFHCKG